MRGRANPHIQYFFKKSNGLIFLKIVLFYNPPEPVGILSEKYNLSGYRDLHGESYKQIYLLKNYGSP